MKREPPRQSDVLRDPGPSPDAEPHIAEPDAEEVPSDAVPLSDSGGAVEAAAGSGDERQSEGGASLVPIHKG